MDWKNSHLYAFQKKKKKELQVKQIHNVISSKKSYFGNRHFNIE